LIEVDARDLAPGSYGVEVSFNGDTFTADGCAYSRYGTSDSFNEEIICTNDLTGAGSFAVDGLAPNCGPVGGVTRVKVTSSVKVKSSAVVATFSNDAETHSVSGSSCDDGTYEVTAPPVGAAGVFDVAVALNGVDFAPQQHPFSFYSRPKVCLFVNSPDDPSIAELRPNKGGAKGGYPVVVVGGPFGAHFAPVVELRAPAWAACAGAG
jgi:hypothetical protein